MTQPAVFSLRYKRVVTVLLMTAYSFNAMDRNLISIISQPLKADLRLSDTELGLLGGTAFAVLYAFGGIPIARMAERFNRVNIMALALAAWSALSALCGLAGNFTQLLLVRVGVGVAESGCSPPAHSLISDYFPASQRTSALSVYSCGTSVGYLLAAIGGGYVAQHWGWRTACAMVGLPGVGIALLIKLCIHEPPRESPAPRVFALRAEGQEVIAVAKSLLLDRPILHMVLGVTLGGFGAYGFYAFIPAYYSRAFGLDYASIGVIVGLAGGAAVGFGIVAGGFIADFLARTDARWYALVPAAGTLLAVPLYGLSLTHPNATSAGWLLAIAGFFQYASLGPTFGVVQNVVDPRRRATATAILYILLNVFSLGCGPLFAGWAIDRFASTEFRRFVDVPFAVLCPGGIAPSSAGAVVAAACHATLASATRHGITMTLFFFAWASLHYFLAARGLANSLRRAAVHNFAMASSVQSDSM
jgi:predicted MFS family arabinose efflux permease